MGDVSYSFKDGKAFIDFKATGLSNLRLYEKEYGSDNYGEASKLDAPSFSSAHYDSSWRVVGNDSAGKERALEIPSYLNGKFNNPNIKIFSPKDNHAAINSFISQHYEALRAEEWSNQRIEMLFLPGQYQDVTLSLGYYMSARGLGYSPDDCDLGTLEVRNHPNTGNALINFWRSLENLSFENISRWAISQATSIRRSHFKSSLRLSDPEGGNGWSSGGYIANTQIDGVVDPGSQQQFLMRNDSFSSWSQSNINMVFEGCEGRLPSGTWLQSRTTNLENSLDVIEKPYLVFDENKGYGFMIPKNLRQTVSFDFNDEADFVSLDDFYIATPEKDNGRTINDALKNHRYLLFTPGIYDIKQTIYVENDDTVITGLGYATLSAESMLEKVMSVKGRNCKISSLLFQSETEIDNFLTIEKTETIKGRTLLSDLFFRIGGQAADVSSVQVALQIDQDFVICDHFWIWRADHGKNIGFDKNYAKNGCIINGDEVVAHAMMVEHFYQYQLIWNGENGQLVFYQSETPYDLPSQQAWMRDEPGIVGEAVFGYPSYKINNSVQNHIAYGIGIYYVNTSKLHIWSHTALECPYNDGISLEHVSSRHFTGDGQINCVVNDLKGSQDGKNLTIEFVNKEALPELFS